MNYEQPNEWEYYPILISRGVKVYDVSEGESKTWHRYSWQLDDKAHPNIITNNKGEIINIIISFQKEEFVGLQDDTFSNASYSRGKREELVVTLQMYKNIVKEPKKYWEKYCGGFDDECK